MTAPARPTSARRPGFTLIELILVLTILTLVVTAVVPNFRAFSVGRQSKYTATQFLALARYARTQSVSEGRVYRLYFEEPAGFHLAVDNGAGTFVELTNEFGRKYPVPEGVRLEYEVPQREEGRYLEFRPDGLGDSGRVTFISANGDVTNVVAESETEIFRVVDGGGQ